MIEIQNFIRDKSFKQFELLSSENSLELITFKKSLSNGNSLPNAFKDFLIKYNGGVFHQSLFINGPLGPVVVATFLPISNTETNSINKTYPYFKDTIGDGFIPFGSDPGGNYFLLGSKESNWNRVYFWDHEKQTTHELSNSFESFMNSLMVDE